MFFILSKILAFLLKPLTWICILLLMAFFGRDERRRKRSLIMALIALFIFSNSFLFDEAARIWEVPAVPHDTATYEYGIVLGGMSVFDLSLGRAQFYRGVDRLMQGVELYRKGKIRKLVFTGGSGSVNHPEQKEGLYIRTYLLYMGIPEKDFIMESSSQNTRENAVYTKALLGSTRDVLLITSAIHMRRATACFEKAGFVPHPWSADRYAGPRKFEFDHMFIPESSALYDWNNLLHEVAGYVIYSISGYI